LFSNTVIPNRGAWLEYETDSNDVLSVRIDRTRKLPLTVLVRALGYGTDLEITSFLARMKEYLRQYRKTVPRQKRKDFLRYTKGSDRESRRRLKVQKHFSRTVFRP